MRRVLAMLGGAIGLMLVAYALFAERSAEEMIADKLDQLEAAVAVTADTTNPLVRASKVNAAFEELFTEDVRFSIPELSSAKNGRRSLANLATGAGRYFRTLDVDFGSLDIEVAADESSAEVRSEASVNAVRAGGGLDRDKRTVHFSFVNRDQWLISRVRVVPNYASEME